MARKTSIEKMTVSVFEIKPLTESIARIDLSGHLHSTLDSTNTARERLMPLSNDENNKDSDFISNFVFSQKFLFGSFVRLNAGEESSVTKASLNKKIVRIDEMISEAQEGSEGSIHTSAFFCIHEHFMVMNSAHANKKALEVYINWFLREHNDELQQCVFVPMKNTANTIPVKDIQSIKFADTYLRGDARTENASLNLTKDLLKKLFNDVKTPHDFNLEDVISATLTLTINKRELKKGNAAVLDTALRLVDSDEIVITGKGGKRIRGTQYLCTTTIEYERVGNSLFNEKAIDGAMRKILMDVKNGKVVS